MIVYSRFIPLSGMVAVLTLLCANMAHAQTTLFSTGFEASDGYSTTLGGSITFDEASTGDTTTFDLVPGSIFAQPLAWRVSRTGSETFATGVRKAADAAVISSTVAASGTQSLFLNGTTGGSQALRYETYRGVQAANNGVIRVSADIRVSNPSATTYGQWGINLLNDVNGPLLASAAAFGTVGTQVVASTDGTDLYAAINAVTGVPISASYGSFNNYAIQMNYGARNISGYFNNAQVAFVPINPAGTPIGSAVLNIPFAATTTNTLSDITFGQFLTSGSSENANFDNFQILGTNSVVVPETGTFALMATGAASFAGMVLARRRKTA